MVFLATDNPSAPKRWPRKSKPLSIRPMKVLSGCFSRQSEPSTSLTALPPRADAVGRTRVERRIEIDQVNALGCDAIAETPARSPDRGSGLGRVLINENWASIGPPMSALEPTPVANPRIWALPPVAMRPNLLHLGLRGEGARHADRLADPGLEGRVTFNTEPRS